MQYEAFDLSFSLLSLSLFLSLFIYFFKSVFVLFNVALNIFILKQVQVFEIPARISVKLDPRIEKKVPKHMNWQNRGRREVGGLGGKWMVWEGGNQPIYSQ